MPLWKAGKSGCSYACTQYWHYKIFVPQCLSEKVAPGTCPMLSEMHVQFPPRSPKGKCDHRGIVPDESHGEKGQSQLQESLSFISRSSLENTTLIYLDLSHL